MDKTPTPARRPTLIVVCGAPDDVELAAVTAVLVALVEARAAPAGSGLPVAGAVGEVCWKFSRDYRSPSAWTSR